MRKTTLLSIVLLSFCLVASAQEKPPVPLAELGFNYTFDHWNPGGTVPSFTENGGSGTVVFNINRYLGVVGDLGAYHAGIIGGSSPMSLNNTTFSYMGGPRLIWRKSRFSPYIQGLVGGAHLSNAFDIGATPPNLGLDRNVFAGSFGGGMDVRLTDHIAFKPFELDYFMTRLNVPSLTETSISNNLRFSTGIVFRFGSK